MRRTLVAIGLLMALAGCSGEKTATPRPQVTTAPAAETPTAATGPDRFLAAVRQQLPQVALDRRDEEVEDLGQQACTAIAAGRNASAAAGEISEQGVPAADARKLVALAATTVC